MVVRDARSDNMYLGKQTYFNEEDNKTEMRFAKLIGSFKKVLQKPVEDFLVLARDNGL